jgi:hypothetical protein
VLGRRVVVRPAAGHLAAAAHSTAPAVARASAVPVAPCAGPAVASAAAARAVADRRAEAAGPVVPGRLGANLGRPHGLDRHRPAFRPVGVA